jgi:hypothetical protein
MPDQEIAHAGSPEAFPPTSDGASGAITIVGFHGTLREFRHFDPDKFESEYGCFFLAMPVTASEYAEGPGGRILRATLTMNSPFRCTAAEWLAGTAPDPADVATDGIHDGYVILGLDGDDCFIAWRPDQIRQVAVHARYGTPEFDVLVSTRIANENGEPSP